MSDIRRVVTGHDAKGQAIAMPAPSRPRASALLKGRSPCHDEALRTQVAPKLLAEQRLDVRLVVDDQDIDAQLLPPVRNGAASVRGSVMMNSV